MSKELIEELRNAGYVAHADLIERLQRENEGMKESVDWWMKYSAAAWDKCEERRLELTAAQAKVAELESALMNSGLIIESLHAREAKLRGALESIATNSCCETCIEASLVAAKALAQTLCEEKHLEVK